MDQEYIATLSLTFGEGDEEVAVFTARLTMPSATARQQVAHALVAFLAQGSQMLTVSDEDGHLLATTGEGVS